MLTQNEINKLVIFFATRYTFPDLNTYHKEQRNVAGKLNMWTNAHPYTQEEIPLLEELDPYFKEILNCEFSHQVFGFELLALWARNTNKELRPLLNINNVRIKKGSMFYLPELLALKHKNGFMHKQKKQIVEDSVAVAEKFWEFISTYEREEVA